MTLIENCTLCFRQTRRRGQASRNRRRFDESSERWPASRGDLIQSE
jgi:hypothetical protein